MADREQLPEVKMYIPEGVTAEKTEESESLLRFLQYSAETILPVRQLAMR